MPVLFFPAHVASLIFVLGVEFLDTAHACFVFSGARGEFDFCVGGLIF